MSINWPTKRFADKETAQQYPLPCQTSELRFWPLDNGRWRTLIELPQIPAKHILIPSFAALTSAEYEFQFVLSGADGAWQAELPTVPSTPTAAKNPAASSASDRVSCHIDYYASAHSLEHATLQLTTDIKPSRYLLCASVRPQELPAEALVVATHNDLKCGSTEVGPLLSQRLGPAAIRGGICSPTAMTMALRDLAECRQPIPDLPAWLDIVQACRDAATGMYGVWPLNVQVASRLGFIGAVEAFTDWADICTCLASGLPLVASIRYAAGELPNAPQPSTGGHLVLVRGVDNDRVLVSDPGAADLAGVSRYYGLAEFTRAWLSHRGAAYVLLPPPQTFVPSKLPIHTQTKLFDAKVNANLEPVGRSGDTHSPEKLA